MSGDLEPEELRRSIRLLRDQQARLGLDFGPQIADLERRLAGVAPPQSRDADGGIVVAGSGAAAATGGVAGGESSVVAGRDITGPVVVTGDGARIIIGEPPVKVTAVSYESALGRYLAHLIARNRHLQLQGIRSGGKLVSVELEHVYVTLKTSRARAAESQDAWLGEERKRAPGELARAERHETAVVSVQEALAEHRRMVILGDPGSGKTTLLRYLALAYGRARAEDKPLVTERLGLAEDGFLPIVVSLRNLGAYLKAHHARDDGTDGHGLLLDLVRQSLRNERITLPDDFFDAPLEAGRAVLLLDGLDEVGDAELRRRVARLTDDWARAYPACRIVVTSRVVGYTGASRLGEGFATTTIRDFTLADVELFLSHWNRLVLVGQIGPGEDAERAAAEQTRQLLAGIRGNERVRDLAINPLMLTVIALVHRDRVKLPDRRAELYAEAVDVLLGKWDEARGVEEFRVLDDRPFDTGDRRLLLQRIALAMHAAAQKEIAAGELRTRLEVEFAAYTRDPSAAPRSADRFLRVIQERTGLLVEAGPDAYRFSHLTFQEYLAAVEVAEREDYVENLLSRSGDPFWREVILLAAGYLSTKSGPKVAKLIRALADRREEPELFHNMVLAAECIRDVGPMRVEHTIAEDLQRRLRHELDKPVPARPGAVGRLMGAAARRRAVLLRRIAAATALTHIESGDFGAGAGFWSLPYGEPDWVTIPEGEFWMGSGDGEGSAVERPLHRLPLPAFQIAPVPVTCAQYQLYVEATGAEAPPSWSDGRPPKDRLNHPVVDVTWHDACAYAEWLGRVTGKPVRLPSEAQWEKAARGDRDQRAYPWGPKFEELRCNSGELDLGETTPVGTFVAGKSPFGVVDLSGNVWEWTASLWGTDFGEPEFLYPYQPSDGREDPGASDPVLRVLRGGAFLNNARYVRCAVRDGGHPDGRLHLVGFRVAVSPFDRL